MGHRHAPDPHRILPVLAPKLAYAGSLDPECEEVQRIATIYAWRLHFSAASGR